ncbi:hypothetical protein KR200_006167, partial [Drosophila serrata]
LNIFGSVSLFKFVFKMLLKNNYRVRFISINHSGGTDYVDLSQIRLLGRERSANGTIELKKDFSDELYSVSAESFSDPSGNGEFKQLPMFIPRQPICKVMESYWKYMDASFKYGVNTDYPVHIRPCPVPKGLYYIKNVTFQTDNWPSIMPRGFLKGLANLYYKNEVVSTAEILIQISDLS